MANNFTFEGRLGADVETRFTAQGKAVASFSVATTTGFGDREKTTWVKCVMFGALAEGKIKDYLLKGQQVFVSGELSMNEFTGRDGAKVRGIEVVVQSVKLLGGKPNQGYSEPQRSGGIPKVQPPLPPLPDYDEFEDDIPF